MDGNRNTSTYSDSRVWSDTEGGITQTSSSLLNDARNKRVTVKTL